MDLSRPSLVPIAHNPDLRGAHHKFFGDAPGAIATPGFSVEEVFMTQSHRDVVRGLHVQVPPQAKLVTVVSGAIVGNAVCCDPTLPEFGKTFSFKLAAQDRFKLYMPGRWAQGYRVLMDDTRVLYLADEKYSSHSIGINPFDPVLGLDWGRGFGLTDAVMAEKDKDLPGFAAVVEQLEAAFGKEERNEA